MVSTPYVGVPWSRTPKRSDMFFYFEENRNGREGLYRYREEDNTALITEQWVIDKTKEVAKLLGYEWQTYTPLDWFEKKTWVHAIGGYRTDASYFSIASTSTIHEGSRIGRV